MSNQPIPKKILDTHQIEEKPFYTLIIDGNSLLEVAFNGDPRINSRGEHIGGVFQFLLQLKILMMKRDFDYVYVFWDGDNSGQLRYDIYPEYKSNREKSFADENINSDYYKQIDNFVKRVLDKRNNKPIDPEKVAKKERFHKQRKILQEYLEELFIRQSICDKIEGDDMIAYYCLHKKPNERIFIVSGDRDLTQLLDIDEYICLYIPVLKKFITTKNHTEEIGYHQKNVLLKKILCGDASDAIKGIKGLGETTLYDMMPEIKEREVKLYEVVERCKTLMDERAKNKLKPLKVHENIVNQVSDGLHNGNVFEINRKIINLKEPLLSHDAITMIEDMMHVPIDSEGRSMANLYTLMLRDDIDELLNKDKFSTFFSTFNKTIDKEKKFYDKWLKDNK
jgi:5'-3' exonuclease